MPASCAEGKRRRGSRAEVSPYPLELTLGMAAQKALHRHAESFGRGGKRYDGIPPSLTVLGIIARIWQVRRRASSQESAAHNPTLDGLPLVCGDD